MRDVFLFFGHDEDDNYNMSDFFLQNPLVKTAHFTINRYSAQITPANADFIEPEYEKSDPIST